jgi:hypothetical protein
MIGDFVHRSNMVSRLLIAASWAVPASALAQPLEGNPLDGPSNGDGPSRPWPLVKPAMTARRVDVANMTSTTALSLKVFLRSNDKEMSDLIVSNSETDNLMLRERPCRSRGLIPMLPIARPPIPY